MPELKFVLAKVEISRVHLQILKIYCIEDCPKFVKNRPNECLLIFINSCRRVGIIFFVKNTKLKL